MKVEIEQKEKQFEPIKLVITIESEEDVIDLWHRFNENNIDKFTNPDLGNFKKEDKLVTVYSQWRLIDNLAKSLNLKK